MLTPINPGAIVSFYEGFSSRSKARHVTMHDDGWSILARRDRLIPMILWLDEAPATVEDLILYNLKTGAVYALDTALVTRVKRNDETRTWYMIMGNTYIGHDVPCGLYEVRMKISAFYYTSEALRLENFQGQEYTQLVPNSCAAGDVEIGVLDSFISDIDYSRTEWKLASADAWTEVSVAGSAFTITPPAKADDDYIQIRRTVKTSTGAVLKVLYSLTYNDSDVCGTQDLVFIDDTSEYPARRWALEFSDSKSWGDDIVYKAGFKQMFYFDGYWDFPATERTQEVLISNLGVETLSTALTKQYIEMEMAKIPDMVIYPLTALADHSAITIKSMNRDVQVDITNPQFSFEPEQGYFSKGKIRFLLDQYFERTCATEETTTTL